jgi:hypothetical protein
MTQFPFTNDVAFDIKQLRNSAKGSDSTPPFLLMGTQARTWDFPTIVTSFEATLQSDP